jgi:hypothetical protein
VRIRTKLADTPFRSASGFGISSLQTNRGKAPCARRKKEFETALEIPMFGSLLVSRAVALARSVVNACSVMWAFHVRSSDGKTCDLSASFLQRCRRASSTALLFSPLALVVYRRTGIFIGAPKILIARYQISRLVRNHSACRGSDTRQECV